MSNTITHTQRWRAALAIYSQRRVLTMLFLGFSSGLPYLLIFSTLTVWLSESGLSYSAIGFFSLMGITYSIKFFWAPIIDRTPIPLLTRLLGKRRSWILAGQIGIALGLCGMAVTDPTLHLSTLACFGLLTAFSSATQDICIDAYRIETAEENLQAAMAATYVTGYRISILIAGAGALYIAEYASWTATYFAMASLMLIGIITTLTIKEPVVLIPRDSYLLEQRVIDFIKQIGNLSRRRDKIMAWFIGAIVCPFTDFFLRHKKTALFILALICVYRFSDIAMGIMANPLYVKLGYSKKQIADIGKLFGFCMTIFGAGLGGILVARIGIMKPLLLGAILSAITNLLFAWLATHGQPDTLSLALVICADNISGGLSNAVFIAYLSSLTSTYYTATQYALFSSLMTLPSKLISSYSGLIVDTYGFTSFFIYATLLGIPATLLILFLMRISPAYSTRIMQEK